MLYMIWICEWCTVYLSYEVYVDSKPVGFNVDLNLSLRFRIDLSEQIFIW